MDRARCFLPLQLARQGGSTLAATGLLLGEEYSSSS